MRLICLPIAALLLAPPLTARDAAPQSDNKQVSASNETEALCNKLIDEARRIDSILRGISDKASADKAAAELECCRVNMQAYLTGLETMPFDAETTHIITTQMTALTHITQGYMERVNELQQAGSFDSQLLTTQLNKLLADEGYTEEVEEPSESAPHAETFAKMEHLLSEALYMLRKTQDTATAKDAASSLRDIVTEHEALLKSLCESQEPSDSETTPQAPTLPATEELSTEFERLQEAEFYGDPDLSMLLQRYIKSFN